MQASRARSVAGAAHIVTVASSRLATVRTTRCAWPASAVCRGRTYSTSVPASRRTTRRANPALHTHTLIYKCLASVPAALSAAHTRIHVAPCRVGGARLYVRARERVRRACAQGRVRAAANRGQLVVVFLYWGCNWDWMDPSVAGTSRRNPLARARASVPWPASVPQPVSTAGGARVQSSCALAVVGSGGCCCSIL